MKVLAVSVFLILLPSLAYPDIDSLQQALQSTDEVNSRITTEIELLDAYFRQGLNEKALELGHQILKYSEVQADQELMARVSNRLGTIYTNIGGKQNEALKHLTTSLNIYIELDDLYGQGIILNNLGNIYRDLAYDSKAMEYYLKGLEICKQINDSEGESFLLKNIGILYEYQGWHEKALEYHSKALSIREELGGDHLIISSLLNVAIAYNGLKNYETALLTLERAEPLARAIESELIDEIVKEKGTAYQALNINDKAEVYFQEAINKAIMAQKYKVVSAALEDLILLNLETGDYDAMYTNLNRLGSLLDSINYIRGQVNYELLYYKYDSINNDELSALRHFQRMSQLNDSLYEVSNREDLIQQRSALELLQTENELELQRAEQQYQSKIYTYIFTFLVISLFGLSYTVYAKVRSNRLLNKQKEEIFHKNEKLRKLNNQLNDTIEELSAANEIIEDQNRIISKNNEQLEKQVAKRTKRIVDYSKQLEEYAFITAHNLRAPVARLLGLGNLLTITIKEEERNIVITKIIATTKEIDEVVHEISTALEDKVPLRESTEG